MALVQIINNFYKKKLDFIVGIKAKKLKILTSHPIAMLSFIAIFSVLFFSVSILINKKNQENKNNFTEVTKSSDFSSLTNYLISKINSPYVEVSYVINKNDTIEKILKNYNIKSGDIKKISTKLKEKKLSNIYSGRKLSLIFKKLDNGSNTVVNLIYPLTNTSSVEIRKFKNEYVVKENILQLYKKEVVARNIIKNNLYSSAINAGVEPT